MKYKEELSRVKDKAGFVIVHGIVDGSEFGCQDYPMHHCETPTGEYIGNIETTEYLCKQRGIAPELAGPSHNVCSIGYCKDEDKWYGWSHRTIFDFGIGSEVKRGDCAYVPIDMEDARLEAIRFWSEDSHQNVDASLIEDEDGKSCFRVSWLYPSDADLIPNRKLLGTIGSAICYPPEVFGRGEWIAETLEDAKQMAIDFAESVS